MKLWMGITNSKGQEFTQTQGDGEGCVSLGMLQSLGS